MNLLPKMAFAGLLMLSASSITQSAQAQVTINVNPPSWGPAAPAGTQYYYIPEVGGYYDLRDQQYIVLREGKWKKAKVLNGYSTSAFHPVVINYVGAQPWVLIQEHKVKYPKAGHPHGMPPGQAKKAHAVDGKGGKGKSHGKGKH